MTMIITMNPGARELAGQLARRTGAQSIEGALLGAIQTGLLALESARPITPIAGDDLEAFTIEPTAEQLARAEQLAELHRVDWSDMPTGRVLATAAQIGLEKLTRSGSSFRCGVTCIGPRREAENAS